MRQIAKDSRARMAGDCKGRFGLPLALFSAGKLRQKGGSMKAFLLACCLLALVPLQARALSLPDDLLPAIAMPLAVSARTANGRAHVCSPVPSFSPLPS